MRRDDFVVRSASVVAALLSLPALAPQRGGVSQSQLASALPSAQRGLWVRYIMGFGTPYQQQIGFGIEHTPLASRYFIETQMGMPGGSCNPNTVRKAYLKTRTFGKLIDVYGIEAYVSKSGTLLMLDEQHPAPLRLLDSPHLYTSATGTIAERGVTNASAPAHAAPLREGAITVPLAQHRVDHVRVHVDDRFLRAFELWSAPALPLGVARMRADVNGMPPFELTLDSYGFDFYSQIEASLDAVRAQQS